MNRLDREFFNRDTVLVANDLLGKYLVRNTERGDIIGKIIEVEAYLGTSDKASHCYNNKKTEKTKIMYMKPGILYIYFIYGIYFCLNVITEPEGIPCAVFIRKLYPIEGIDKMIENRNVKIGKNYRNLIDGPSKLCMALGITKDKYNGTDSTSLDSSLFFTKGENVNKSDINSGKRIGIDYAEEDKDRLIRFFIED
jgi:DNA-3-methyladenine glycosylase